MTTYQLQVNETLPLGRSIVKLLKSANDAVTLTPIRKKTAVKEEHSPLYYSLKSGFHDVKLMMDGKKRKKTAEEFLYEIRNNND